MGSKIIVIWLMFIITSIEYAMQGLPAYLYIQLLWRFNKEKEMRLYPYVLNTSGKEVNGV